MADLNIPNLNMKSDKYIFKNSLPISVQNKFNFDEGEQWSLITIRGLGVTVVQNQIEQLMYWFESFIDEINNFDKDLQVKKINY